MPFLHIVGAYNTGQNFKFACYFLLSETEGDYNFIIQQIYFFYF